MRVTVRGKMILCMRTGRKEMTPHAPANSVEEVETIISMGPNLYTCLIGSLLRLRLRLLLLLLLRLLLRLRRRLLLLVVTSF